MMGRLGKVSGKRRLVNGDVLDGTIPPLANVDDAVNQEKRETAGRH